MIKCPKCDTDNMIGAIFCRGCGAKLEIDDLQPSDIKIKKEKDPGATATLIRNIIAGIIFLVVVAVVVLLLQEPAFAKPAALSPEQRDAAVKKWEFLTERKVARAYTFSEAELNFLAKHALDLTEETKEEKAKEAATSSQGWRTVDIWVQLRPGGTVRIIKASEYDLFGAWKMYSILEGKPKVTGDKGLSFEVTHAQCGTIPLNVGFLQDQVAGAYDALIAKDEVIQDQ